MNELQNFSKEVGDDRYSKEIGVQAKGAIS
jgi:hypothetical protein